MLDLPGIQIFWSFTSTKRSFTLLRFGQYQRSLYIFCELSITGYNWLPLWNILRKVCSANFAQRLQEGAWVSHVWSSVLPPKIHLSVFLKVFFSTLQDPYLLWMYVCEGSGSIKVFQYASQTIADITDQISAHNDITRNIQRSLYMTFLL